MTAQVFISHSSKDRELAETLCRALEKRNLTCWISCRDIEPGQDFGSAIVRAIRGCKVMVLIFTNNANSSGEITKELALASQNRLVVIPARVEDVIPSDALAYQLATSQWVDVFRDWEDAVDRMARQARAVAGVEAGAPAAPPSAHVPPSAPVPPPITEQPKPQPTPAPAPRPAAPAAAQARIKQKGAVLLNVVTGQVIRTLDFPFKVVTDLAFSSEGKRIVAGGYDGRLCVSESETGQLLLSLGGDQLGTQLVTYSPDDRWIVSGISAVGSSTLRIWDAVNGALVHELKPVTPPLWCIATSPDGTMLATGNGVGGIKIWNMASGQGGSEFQTNAGGVHSLAFSPDSKRLAAGNHNGSIMVWDITAAKLVSTLWHVGTVNSVAFSPNGERIVAGGYGGTVPVWSARTNQRLRTLKEHAATVRDVAFSPDGRLIASGSDDRTIKMWDPDSGQLVRTIDTRAMSKLPAASIAFSPGGTTLAMVSSDPQPTDMPTYWDAIGYFAAGFGWLALAHFGPFVHPVSRQSGDLVPLLSTWIPAIGAWWYGIKTLIKKQDERALKQKLEQQAKS